MHDESQSFTSRYVMRSRLETILSRFQNLLSSLREYQVALVCADTVEWPRLMDLTSDFVYCRLHGSEVLYVSGYTDEGARRMGQKSCSMGERLGAEGCGESDPFAGPSDGWSGCLRLLR